MANVQDIVKLAIDSYRGCGAAAKYSKADTQASLLEALRELNGGSTKFDARTMRSDKGHEIFSIVEEVIEVALNDYWTNNEQVNRLVEYRNIALGDEQEFYVKNDELLAVATISEGNTNVRRQRIEGGRSFTIPTQLRAIKVYEEMNRVLAGRVDFNHLIDMAVNSMAKDAYERQMLAWSAIDQNTKDAGGVPILGTTYYKTGTYSENVLLDLIADVEADTNETAVIYGTKKALRMIGSALTQVSSNMKDELYNQGYLGKFYGTDCVAMKQTHQLDGSMLLDDKTIYVMAASEKPVKYITNGDGLILQKDPTQNADLTYEWLYTERTGVGLVVNKKFGKYVMA